MSKIDGRVSESKSGENTILVVFISGLGIGV
jgi:hypothetical protein